MKVAFHLRRKPQPESPSALLLESDRVEEALDLIGRLGSDRAPTVYRVAEGFLVKLDGDREPPVGPIRLRRLAEHLYLPVDAELVPELLDDEARGITRDLGLVFLPAGRVLAFDPAHPLSASSMVEASRFEGSGWRPFPERPGRAERIEEISLDFAEDQFGSPFEPDPGPTEVGPEGPPRPEDAGAASTLAGKAAVGVGKGLIGLGAAFGIKALADLGARWIGQAVDRVPRLTEAVLGRQEGALRELLRQFREGDIDRALRHALPLGGEGSRGSFPTGDGQLPTNDPTYSLQSLLGGGRGPSGIWLGGYDVQVELAREYRKAAEEAERRGDYRRAAYIHGRLLNDYTTAAHLLARGGLHRDAAIVYLDRLKDLPAAARAFEAAGEVDRALQLYRRMGLHAEAGDLLRRIGEDEEAVREYLEAAEQLALSVRHGRGAAGDLLRDRAGRPDLAMVQYALGWDARPSDVAMACVHRMATILAEQGESSRLLKLVGEADELFLQPGQAPQARDFYNSLAALADLKSISEARDDLRDRARMGLAAKMRESISASSRPHSHSSVYFGRSGAWPSEVVSDANHASKAEAERKRMFRPAVEGRPTAEGSRRIPVGGGALSAVCHASTSSEIFLGFEGGRVYRVDVGRGLVNFLAEERSPITSLAVAPDGQTLAILLAEEAGPRQLIQLSRVQSGVTGWSRQVRAIDGQGDCWLTPVMEKGPACYLALWDGAEMVLLGGIGTLAILGRLPLPFLKIDPHSALLIPFKTGDSPSGTLLIHEGPELCHVDLQGRMLRRRYLGWRPTLMDGHTLRSAPLSWLRADSERIELAGLDREGVARWSSLLINESELIRTSTNHSIGMSSYAATTLVRAGLLAAVSPSGIDWLRCGPQAFVTLKSTPIALDSPMACYPSHRSGELVVVSGDGTLTCVPLPS